MRKFWLLFCMSAAILSARENPFVPISELNTSVMTTNIVEQYPEFDRQDIKFPSDMSLLLGITIRYRANDGSIKEKVISDINKTVDWKNEYVIEKLKNPEPMVAKKLDVSVTMPELALPKVATPVKISDKNDTNLTAKKDINRTLSMSAPSVVMINLDTQKSNEVVKAQSAQEPAKTPIDVKITPNVKPKTNIHSSSKIVNFMNFVKFDADDGELKILMKSKNIKHFAYEDNKIVMDFSRPPRSFKTRALKFENSVFKGAIIGWHDSYYRVVVMLDKKRKYKLEALKDGYELRVE
ncbi:hypothetical protein [Campylobacter curvus]|uniref:AMIN domain-containing protein n=1 Tax=Campylobacter curvus (strain 525.92) TaxID=360105 RepID=A7H0M3_CAMC5|nr:hypothetical protein [Campylobacter curvus]EAU01381.1 putative protein (AMIN domain) [Campylobacter curvus 525.92]